MFCKYCGNKIKEDDIFCPQCGKKLNYQVHTPQEKAVQEDKINETPNTNNSTGQIVNRQINNEQINNEQRDNEQINNEQINNEQVNNEQVNNEQRDSEQADNEEINNEPKNGSDSGIESADFSGNNPERETKAGETSEQEKSDDNAGLIEEEPESGIESADFSGNNPERETKIRETPEQEKREDNAGAIEKKSESSIESADSLENNPVRKEIKEDEILDKQVIGDVNTDSIGNGKKSKKKIDNKKSKKSKKAEPANPSYPQVEKVTTSSDIDYDESMFLQDTDNNLEDIMNEQLSTKKKKRHFILPVVIALFLLGIICTTIYITGSEGFQLNRNLSLGEKYLSEMEYEKAVAAFTKVIKIEPKCMKGYLGLADAYLGLKDEEKAIDALLQGIEVVEYYSNEENELIPMWDDLYIKLADIYLNQGNYKNAREIIQRGIVIGDSIKLQKKLRDVDTIINSILERYTKSYDAYLVNFPEYIMTEDETNQYNNNIAILTEGIDNIDVAKCVQSVKIINKLEEQLITNNLEYINGLKVNLEGEYTPDAYEVELTMINGYSAKVDELINRHWFVSAQNILDQWRDLLNTISVASDYTMEVSQVDVSEYPIIKLYIRVEDVNTGETIDTLEYEYFSLKEKDPVTSEYKEMAIRKAVQLDEEENTNICIVADVSSSMYGEPIDSAKEIMNKFIDTIQFDIGDKAELITFATDVYTDVPFTTKANRIKNAINNIYTRDRTAFYDALYQAITSTAKQGGAKCIIAFTDGMDNESIYSYETVIELAQKYKIPIFIIGVGYIDDYYINAVTEQTGGFYRNIYDISSMEEVYNSIYRQQKMLYLIEYETQQAIEEVMSQEIYINYKGNDIISRSEYEYNPADLMEGLTSETSNTTDNQMYLNDYIIYDSDSRYLALSDIEYLSEEELKLARNEIYARKGRRFKDTSLQEYFDNKMWYYGYIEPDDFTESLLNVYEIANANLIKDYEATLGYNTEG